MPGLPVINWVKGDLIQDGESIPVKYIGSYRPPSLVINTMTNRGVYPQWGAYDEFESAGPVKCGIGPFLIKISEDKEFQVLQIQSDPTSLHYKAILE